MERFNYLIETVLKRIYNRAGKHEILEITSSPLPQVNRVIEITV